MNIMHSFEAFKTRPAVNTAAPLGNQEPAV